MCDVYKKARRLQAANATGMIVVSWTAYVGVFYPTNLEPPADVTLPSLVVNRYDGENLFAQMKSSDVVVKMTPAGNFLL